MKKLIFKKYMLLLTLLFTGLAGWSSPTLFSGGNGSAASPYRIATLADLKYLSEHSAYWGSGIYFIQTANIDAFDTRKWNVGNHDGNAATPDEPMGFSPIGRSNSLGTTSFQGSYDGQGYVIEGLYMHRIPEYIGLFGWTENSTIKNVGLVDVDFYIYSANIGAYGNATGALCGTARACTIQNCFSTGTVYSEPGHAGGLLGTAESTCQIKNCYSMARVHAFYYVGGFVGSVAFGVNLERCYSTGLVTHVFNGDRHGPFYGYKETAGTPNILVYYFFDKQTSGYSTSTIYNAKTTAEMQDIYTYLNASTGEYGVPGIGAWQIDSLRSPDSIWNIDVRNNGYPYLSYQTFPIFVNSSSTAATPDGNSWEAAYPDLQDAIAAADSGRQIWVAKGTYYPSVEVGGSGNRYKTFQMKEGVRIYGGFAGTETLLSERSDFGYGETNETILSGDIGIVGDSTDNCYHVVFNNNSLTNTALLDGFSITKGYSNGSWPNNNGAAIMNYQCAPILNNLNIYNNYNGTGTAGIYTFDTDANYSNLKIFNNHGVGLAFSGISSNHLAATVNNLLTYGNTNTTNYVLDLSYSTVTINNATISGNTASKAIGISNSEIIFNNGIIRDNSGTDIYLHNTSSVQYNYTCYNDAPGKIDVESGSTFTPDAHCITSVPQFANDVIPDDYRIRATSPCANAGNNSANTEIYDIRGQKRIANTTIDMGAYEFTPGYDIICTNPTAGGTIGAEQIVCYETEASSIQSTSSPSGHVGTLEYKWQSSAIDSLSGFADIANSNSSTYAPGAVTDTTWYKRLVRVSCWPGWSGAAESNVVMIGYIMCQNPTSGGTIGTDQTIETNTKPAPITNIESPQGYSGSLEYQWQKSTTGSTSGFSDIVTATSESYTENSFLSQTTWYKRKVKVASESDWVESNIVKVIVGDFKWQLVGAAGFTSGTVNVTSMACDNSGTPHVSYEDNNAGTCVMKFNGVQWERLGTSDICPSGSASYISLAFDSSGTPYIAYSTSSIGEVKKYQASDSTWVLVGAANCTGGQAYYISLAINSSGTPYIAFQDYNNSNKATVRKYDGSSWVTVGSAAFSANKAEYISLVFDNSDKPWIAYKDHGNSKKATVQKFNGVSWGLVGVAGFSNGEVTYLSMAIDTLDKPYVGFNQQGKASVMTYNGSAWSYLGPTTITTSDALYQKLALNNSGTPYFAFRDNANSYKASTLKYNGSAWVAVGGTGFSSGAVSYTTLAFNNNNNPHVFFQDADKGNKGTVMKYSIDCPNPTNGGTIATADTIKAGEIPDSLISTAPATGAIDGVEYIWQYSTESDSTGFVNIPDSYYEGYQPGKLYETTWFKRLARSGCNTIWIGATESNVLEIKVIRPLKLVFDMSTPGTVKIPLKGTVDVVIDWGDGSTPEAINSAGNAEHTYTISGTDTVTITGTLTGLGTNSGLAEYQNNLTKVLCWGDIGLEDLNYACYNCTNLMNVPDEIPAEADTLKGTFKLATSLDKDFSDWDITNVADMTEMLSGVTLSTINYNSLLTNWASQNVKDNVIFDAGGSRYSLSVIASRQSLIDDHNWTIYDGGGDFLFNGSGTLASPFQITNLNDLKNLSENSLYWSYHFIQTADIDASATLNWNISGNDTLGFIPIGNATTKFEGSYNGQGKTITGLFINRPTTNYVGLFGYTNNAPIENINIIDCNITGNANTGGIIGYANNGYVKRCSSAGKINAKSAPAGFIIGYAECLVNECFSEGVLKSTSHQVGGLVGAAYDTIQDCYSMAQVTGNTYVGGLVGYAQGAVAINCYSAGSVSGNATYGGLIGYLWVSSATNCYWNSDTISTGIGQNQVGTLNNTKGLNTAKMKDTLNFVGWDFTNIWSIDSIINDGYPYLGEELVPAQPLQLVFTTTTPNQLVTIPLKGTVDVIIDWGDGSDNDTITTAQNASHTYGTAGTDTVNITGTLTGLGTGTTSPLPGYRNTLTKVLNWGDVGLQDLRLAFNYCTLLTDVPNELPSTVTDLSLTFYYASGFNGDIGNWNTSQVTTMANMFVGATSFNQDIGNWDLSNVTTTEWMFAGATAFNKNIHTKLVNESTADEYTAWDMSTVSSMEGMFADATAFNQDIGNWDVSNVTTMAMMFACWKPTPTTFDQNLAGWNISSVTTMEDIFYGSALSTANYDSMLISWAGQAVQPNVSFSAGNSQYTCGLVAAARDTLVAKGWTITDGGLAAECPMQLRFENIDCELQLPLFGTVNCTVTWGDGTAPEHFTTPGNRSHTYATAGNYIVTISGNLSQFGSGGPWGGHNYLTEVITFGNIGLTSLFGAFWASTSIVKVPEELPATVTDLSYCFHGPGSGTPQDSIQNLDKWDVTNVTNMEHLFTGKKGINPDLSGWNTGNVTNMKAMFSSCQKFNADISGWDVSRVKNMHSIFLSAEVFNQDISNWAVDSVTDMSSMFGYAEAFNQDIGSWNVSSVNDMEDMFNNAKGFNQNIGGWDVSKVTNMKSMFEEASAFNQDIGDWDVSEVTNMESMFKKATVFTGDSIGKWAVDSVTTMKDMFNGAAAFNGAIGSWNVDSVTLMDRMFQSATSFNQDIGNWNVSKVTRMTDMFNGATSFNQDIGTWDVNTVTDMAYMFENASSYNYDLGDWILNSDNVDVEHMLDNCGMDCESYSTTLKGWAENPNLPTGRTLGANGLTYGTDAVPYRDTLTINRGWTIQGDIAGTSECMCSDPDDGGNIATAQSICTGSAPDSLTSTALPTGYTGNLEYKWQSSTESDTTGFADIANSNAIGYQSGNLDETTWFKRLAKVDCMPDWTGAASSNVVMITVHPETVGGSVSGDTLVCYGSHTSVLTLSGQTGTVQKWQYSTDGTIWSDLTGHTQTTYTSENLIQDTWYRVVVQSGACQQENSDAHKISVFSDYKISGYARYENNPKTPLSGLKVLLRNGADIIDSVLTTAAGYYKFDGLTNGNFGLIVKSAHPSGQWQTWGGVNNTDYLLVARHIAGTQFLPVNPPVVRTSASVKLPHPAINNTDAVAIRQAAKFPATGYSYFDTTKWVFSGIDATNALNDITVVCADVTRDIRGLCTGDVNGTYVPVAGYKTAEPGLELVNRGKLPITDEIIFPIRVNRDMEIGAITLFLDYDPAAIDITGVTMPVDMGTEPVFETRDGLLYIGWMSPEPIRVKHEETLLLIHARQTDAFRSSQLTFCDSRLESEDLIAKPKTGNVKCEIRFTLNDNPLSEIADSEGNIIDGLTLSIPDATGKPEWRNSQILIYPNPATSTLNVQLETFSLKPETLTLELVNMHGITVLKNQPETIVSGWNKYQMDVNGMAPGVYFLRTNVGGEILINKVLISR